MHYSDGLCSSHWAVTHSLSSSLSPLHVHILFTHIYTCHPHVSSLWHAQKVINIYIQTPEQFFFVTDYRDTSIHFHLSLSLFFSLRHIHIKIQHGWVICNCPRKWQNIKLLTKSILTYAWQMWADKWWNWCTDTLCILCWHCFELIKCWLRI